MSNLKNWALERQGNELYWDGCRLTDLAREFGTPLFVVNRRVLEEAVRSITGVFRPAGLQARVFFSYKTNPVPEVLRAMAGVGVGAEVISELEFRLARRLGLGGERIIVNGGAKSEALLRLSVENGADMITVQRLADLQTLERIGLDLGKKVNVGLRINRGFGRASSASPYPPGRPGAPSASSSGARNGSRRCKRLPGNRSSVFGVCIFTSARAFGQPPPIEKPCGTPCLSWRTPAARASFPTSWT